MQGGTVQMAWYALRGYDKAEYTTKEQIDTTVSVRKGRYPVCVRVRSFMRGCSVFGCGRRHRAFAVS